MADLDARELTRDSQGIPPWQRTGCDGFHARAQMETRWGALWLRLKWWWVKNVGQK